MVHSTAKVLHEEERRATVLAEPAISEADSVGFDELSGSCHVSIHGPCPVVGFIGPLGENGSRDGRCTCRGETGHLEQIATSHEVRSLMQVLTIWRRPPPQTSPGTFSQPTLIARRETLLGARRQGNAKISHLLRHERFKRPKGLNHRLVSTNADHPMT